MTEKASRKRTNMLDTLKKKIIWQIGSLQGGYGDVL